MYIIGSNKQKYLISESVFVQTCLVSSHPVTHIYQHFLQFLNQDVFFNVSAILRGAH